MRVLLFALTIGLSLSAAVRPELSKRTVGESTNPCSMGTDLDRSARSFIGVFLTDTGIIGTVYASRRHELGVTGVSYSQVVVVQDTVACRRVINAWKAHFATLSPEVGAEAADINSSMLFRLTPNRYILATPMLNKYSFLTYVPFDSNWVALRMNL